MTESEFIERFVEEFGIEAAPSLEVRLWEDLNLDSVDMVDLVLFVEELSKVGQIDNPEFYPVIATLRDAYMYYLDLIGSDA